MKKICLISFADVTNPKNGYHIRCRFIVDKMIKQGDEVNVIQYGDKDNFCSLNGVDFFSIKTNHEKKSKENFLFSILSFSILKELFFQYESYSKLKKYSIFLSECDEIYIEGCLLIAPFFFVKKFKKNVIVDTHCLNKDVALKLKKKKKFIGFIRVIIWHFIEKNIFLKADKIITVSENDKNFIVTHYGINPKIISITPNEVIAANYDKYEKEGKILRNTLFVNKNKIAIFIGDFGAIHNKDAENFIRTKLAPQSPEILYVLVGNNPNNSLNTSNICYTGFVEAIDPYIIMADVCIAPLAFGGGTKTKVLDYMKYYKKIIATPVAMEGITSDKNISICELDNFLEKLKI
jgi:glycosyltransferase involved in cell wall biosynthesis